MESQIKNDLKNGIFKNIYVLSGEEKYLTDYYAGEIIRANVDEDMTEFNFLKLSTNLPSTEDIDAFANSYPFMSEKKVLLIQDTGIFKNPTEEYKNYFLELTSSPPEYLIIIFAESNTDKRNSIYKQISKLWPVCEFSFKKPNELSPWLTNLFKKNSKKISSADALYMCEKAGPSMLTLKSEAEKIISFTESEEITRDIIDSLVTRTVENRVFDMLDNLIDGNKRQAMQELSDLKALNEEPIKIISIIFKKFAAFHGALILKSKSPGEISQRTGIPSWLAKNNLMYANKLGGMKIASVMSKCHDMDFGIKNGTVADKWLALELIIAEIIM